MIDRNNFIEIVKKSEFPITEKCKFLVERFGMPFSEALKIIDEKEYDELIKHSTKVHQG